MVDEKLLFEFATEQHIVSRNMETYGGSFASNLARALAHADIINALRIKHTWPELWEKYLKMEDNKQ